MKILSAEFITSAVKPAQYPTEDLAEIAFVGRSNVGKSSLINTLVNRKRLVKTSSTPGRTQLINFFRINENFIFVDLPGYGFARVPRQVQEKWASMIETYLSTRNCLKGVVSILDIRRTPGDTDLNLWHWLAHQQIPCMIVLTKADKLSRSRQIDQQRRIAGQLQMAVDDLLVFSAKTRLGGTSLWHRLEEWITPHVTP